MDRRPVAVVLTGVGKRYDIVSAFSAHATTIAVDPNPLAPARYAADVAVVPPRIDDPGYVPFLEDVVARYGARAVVPLTDLDLEVLAASDLPAFVPSAAVARATYDKYETHSLLLGHGRGGRRVRREARPAVAARARGRAAIRGTRAVIAPPRGRAA